MFALTIGEVGLQTARLVQAGHWVHFLPAYSHLVLATVMIAASWVGWTLSPSPGARQDVSGVLQPEFLVLLVDVILVIVYFIFVRAVDLTGEGTVRLNASAAPEALWIFVIFWLYLLWDFLTKVVLYLKKGREERWFRKYGARILPTVTCLVLAWVTKRLIQTADPAHVPTADLALLALVLFFRASKELVSALLPTQQVSPAELRMRRVAATLKTVLCILVMWVGIKWTRSWPVPKYIAAQIQIAPSEENNHSETSAPTLQPEPRSVDGSKWRRPAL